MPNLAAPVRAVTLNLNGLRSALRKGLLNWLEREAPSVVLLQEVRADPLPDVFAELGYHSAWAPAVKAGYSGVAILSRRAPDEVATGIGDDAHDAEGRLLVARLGTVRVASVYVPSGSSGEPRQLVKDAFAERLLTWAEAHLQAGPLLLGGDFNVAHQAVDLKNWRSNQKNSGFLPHERAWFTRLLATGLADTHRETLGEAAQYTWWSARGQAFANDVGWRLDYLLAAGLTLRNVAVDKEARLSDHAPVIGEIVGPPEVLNALA